MLIAREKEEENIAEYILYMWQMEDLVRGSDMQLDQVLNRIFTGSESAEQIQEYTTWFAGLIEEMHRDGLTQQGHLKGVRTYMKSLDTLHNSLINVYQDEAYIEVHKGAASFIEDLRKKSGSSDMTTIEVCLIGLYGFLMLRISKEKISDETQQAFKEISKMIALLAEAFNKLKRGELKLPKQMNN
jgi:hypothetical protein